MSDTPQRARSTSFSLPPELSEAFMTECKARGYNASGLVRKFIQDTLDTWTKD